jgi:hypothetical protein
MSREKISENFTCVLAGFFSASEAGQGLSVAACDVDVPPWAAGLAAGAWPEIGCFHSFFTAG